MPLFQLPDRSVAIRAILFDKDGTLVDLLVNLLALAKGRAAALRELAGAEAVATWQAAVGADVEKGWVDRDGPLCLAPRRDEILVTAGALYRLGQPWDQARALARAAYDRGDDSLPPPYGNEFLPGVLPMLATLQEQGLRLAIATTAEHARTERAMQIRGAARYFAAIVGVDDVRQGKPAPEMALLACERLGVQPAEAAMVGDSPADLQMGRAAGLAASIGVTTGLNDASRLAPWADLILPTAAELAMRIGKQFRCDASDVIRDA
jgi:phosphoglycolate phosphatase